MATSGPTSEVLSLGLLNINSLRNKIHDVHHMITEHRLHVLALCETHLDDTDKDSKLYLEGFRLWRKDRDTEGRGGVALYVQQHIETKLRPDLMNPDVEIIWVQMLLPGSRPVVVGCCYRPPNSKKLYLDLICKIMNQVSKEEKDMFLMGDFNINWFADPSDKKDKNDLLQRRIEALASECGLTQIVTVATREPQSEETSTCIDHIYTNIPDQCSELKSIPTGCSDHNLITVRVKKTVPALIMSCRSEKRFDENGYIRDLMKVQWTDVFNASDPQEALNKFSELFVSVADEHAPLKMQSIYDSLVMDDEVKSLISERDQAKAEKETDRCKTLDKTSTEHVTKKQTESFRQQLQDAGNDPEKIFQTFKEFIGYRMPPHVINVKPGAHFTSEDDFLKFFNRIHTEAKNFTSVFNSYQHQNSTPFRFQDVDPETVKSLLLNICGRLDHRINKTAELFRAAAELISRPLCHIMNCCIHRGVFPSEFKEIKTTSFSTSEDTSVIKNSTVESIHLVLRLIFDVILLMQTKQYFTISRSIPLEPLQDQYDQLNREWTDAADEGKTVQAVFLDFSSSFDIIRRDLIFDKLKSFIFSDSARGLIKSYLSKTQTDHGLPRGSFFSHFTVYANRLKWLTSPAVVCGNEMIIYYAHRHSQTAKDVMESDIQSVFDWAERNSITLNTTVSKTLRTREEVSDVFQLLKSVHSCDQGQLNWIRALRVILQHRGPYWEHLYKNILKKLEKCFTRTVLKDLEVDELINSLVLLDLEP